MSLGHPARQLDGRQQPTWGSSERPLVAAGNCKIWKLPLFAGWAACVIDKEGHHLLENSHLRLRTGRQQVLELSAADSLTHMRPAQEGAW